MLGRDFLTPVTGSTPALRAALSPLRSAATAVFERSPALDPMGKDLLLRCARHGLQATDPEPGLSNILMAFNEAWSWPNARSQADAGIAVSAAKAVYQL